VETSTSISYFIKLALLGLSTQVPLMGIAHAETHHFTYDDFSNLSQLQLNNFSGKSDLVQNGSSLMLTDRRQMQSMSVFTINPISLSDNLSFSSEFSFKIDHPEDLTEAYLNSNKGGSGLVFVMQSNSNQAGGADAQTIGYGGIENSIGIEFDTWATFGTPENPQAWGPYDYYSHEDYIALSDNHLGLNLNGSAASVV